MHTVHEPILTSPASIRSITGWEEFFDDGNRYLRTASSAYTKGKEIFTPEILYNIIAMAIEKFVMATLMHHGTMPCNHTMADLVAAMEETFSDDAIADIREGLLNLDKYQEICDPCEYTILPPGRNEIPAMLELATRLQELVRIRLA